MGTVNLPSAVIDGRQHAAQRAAESMLRSLGTAEVSLRLAEPASGSVGSQLGLESPTMEDVPLCPAVVRYCAGPRETKARYEVILSSNSLKQAIAEYNVDDVDTWLLTAAGLVYRDTLLHIDMVMVEQFAGAEYLYRVFVTE